jgi:hypothetical protein
MKSYKATLDAEYICTEAELNGDFYDGEDAIKRVKKIKGFSEKLSEIEKFLKWDIESEYIKNVKVEKINAKFTEYGDAISAQIIFKFDYKSKVSDWTDEKYDDAMYDLCNGFLFNVKEKNDFIIFLVNEGYHIEIKSN